MGRMNGMIARRMRLFLLSVMVLLAAPAVASDVAARPDMEISMISDAGDGISIHLAISQAVPYRVFVIDNPSRMVVDFAEVDFSATDIKALDRSDRIIEINAGPIRKGWSRLVATLDGPYRVISAEEKVDSGARILIRLAPVSETEFAALLARPEVDDERFMMLAPTVPAEARRRQTGQTPLMVMLDPGHGGIDPGAQAGGVREADVILSFAEELAVVLQERGMIASLTRYGDYFLPLETRISLARAAGADVFLSLHADTLAEGMASGATIYTLSETASETASALLAERHDRGDLLSGIDLTGQDDLVASVMMDLSRADTEPRSERLAQSLKAAIKASGAKMHRHPIQQAGFTVLKAPDIPSVLLEIGFLSSRADRARLSDADWRRSMQVAIGDALSVWAVADAAEARLIRR